ncbi:MAG: LysR family transcriptional regulator [Bradyrhizobium sp.]|uniref:LysR family transcriptional regulator n=1 Tax=Bradyrhizobium sp. TaxID=376 RepID=UPI0029B8262F|nr:LysR family transcriptional regulator [Bradyrhizobium sp.]MDX3969240.1 LysR family transcriptional regulator [Bradyrhizobium sp.]
MVYSNSDTSPPLDRRLHIAFYQFEHAIAAADYGSFRQAAEALSIKQSTISRSVVLLEHAFGIAIFERSSGGVRATPIGHLVLRMARSIVEQLETLATMTRMSGRGEAGRLVVGFCTSLSAGNLRATLIDFKSRYPQVELATIERSRTGLIAALRNGIVDVHVTVGETLSFDCRATALWSERIVAVLPSDHPLTAQDAVYWTDLRDQTVLLSRHDPGEELEALLNAKLLVTSDRPRVERHDVSRGVIKSLISMGLGISLVLESDMGANFAGLVYREIRDGTGPSRIGFSAVWRGDNENPALANFLKILSERYPFLPEE